MARGKRNYSKEKKSLEKEKEYPKPMDLPDSKKEESVEPMDKEKHKSKKVEKTKLPNSEENKLKFLVWFSAALKRFKELKPHHMTAIQAFFMKNEGLSNMETRKVYDEALYKFGFGRK